MKRIILMLMLIFLVSCTPKDNLESTLRDFTLETKTIGNESFVRIQNPFDAPLFGFRARFETAAQSENFEYTLTIKPKEASPWIRFKAEEPMRFKELHFEVAESSPVEYVVLSDPKLFQKLQIAIPSQTERSIDSAFPDETGKVTNLTGERWKGYFLYYEKDGVLELFRYDEPVEPNASFQALKADVLRLEVTFDQPGCKRYRITYEKGLDLSYKKDL
ncbi:hypothetical protein [Guggenheimella bovis]